MSKNTDIYYFHGREVGLLTGGMPRCLEFSYILFSRCREVGLTQRFISCHSAVRSV